jgi:hypothetical protein
LVYSEEIDGSIEDLTQSGPLACAVPQIPESGGDISGNGNANDGLATECIGLDPDYTLPSACTDTTSKYLTLAKLKLSTETTFVPGVGNVNGIENNGGTQNSVSMAQAAQIIENGYMSNLKPGQKNFIIAVSDGAEDCECQINTVTLPGSFEGASNLAPGLRYDGGDPTLIKSVNSDTRRRYFNAGIKGRFALETIDPALDGSLGDVFVVFFGENGSGAQDNANHWAWESSGYGWASRPQCTPANPVGCARPAFMAEEGDELRDTLKRILTQIATPAGTTVSLGASVVGSVKEVIHTHTNTVDGLTAADVLAADVADVEARKLRASHRNNVLFTTEVVTPGFEGHLRAYNIYEVQSDGTRTTDFTEIWDAGEVLESRDLYNDPRRIYFHRSDGTGGQLSTTLGSATLTAADLGVAAGFLDDLDPTGVGAKSSADAVEIVEKVIQGWRLVIDPTNGFYQASDPTALNFLSDTTSTWKLFDATHSTPAVVLNPPRSPDADPPSPGAEYYGFYDDQINRLTTVFLGTNSGMMHAFRADNGYELYGYIPHDLLTRLPNLVENLVADINGVANHEFFISSSATVQDAYLQDAPSGNPEWRTVLAFGRGAGGKFLTALDITDVGDWDGTTPDPSLPCAVSCVPTGFPSTGPEFLFTVGNRDGVADLDVNGESYDGFGETWSVPVMGRVHSADHPAEGQWVLFAGGGYGCVGTDEGRYFYVLKLEDGTVYRKFGPVADVVDGSAGEPGIDQNGLVATPALFNPHEPGFNSGRDFVTRAYIGDLQGVIHKLDCTDADEANWQFGVFFELTSEADEAAGQGNHDQPITVQAAVLKLAGSDTIYVFVGSGGDTRVTLTDPDRFKIVGVVDTDSASTISTSDPAFQGDLMTLEDGTSKFFLDLPDGERMTVPPVLARNTATNGVVFFATVRTEFNAVECQQEFSSTLFAAGVTTGLGSFDLDPNTAGIQDEVDMGTGKVTGLFHRDEHLYVSKSGQIGAASGTDVLGSDTFPTPAVAAGTVQILVDGFRLSPF